MKCKTSVLLRQLTDTTVSNVSNAIVYFTLKCLVQVMVLTIWKNQNLSQYASVIKQGVLIKL